MKEKTIKFLRDKLEEYPCPKQDYKDLALKIFDVISSENINCEFDIYDAKIIKGTNDGLVAFKVNFIGADYKIECYYNCIVPRNLTSNYRVKFSNINISSKNITYFINNLYYVNRTDYNDMNVFLQFKRRIYKNLLFILTKNDLFEFKRTKIKTKIEKLLDKIRKKEERDPVKRRAAVSLAKIMVDKNISKEDLKLYLDHCMNYRKYRYIQEFIAVEDWVKRNSVLREHLSEEVLDQADELKDIKDILD